MLFYRAYWLTHTHYWSIIGPYLLNSKFSRAAILAHIFWSQMVRAVTLLTYNPNTIFMCYFLHGLVSFYAPTVNSVKHLGRYLCFLEKSYWPGSNEISKTRNSPISGIGFVIAKFPNTGIKFISPGPLCVYILCTFLEGILPHQTMYL